MVTVQKSGIFSDFQKEICSNCAEQMVTGFFPCIEIIRLKQWTGPCLTETVLCWLFLKVGYSGNLQIKYTNISVKISTWKLGKRYSTVTLYKLCLVKWIYMYNNICHNYYIGIFHCKWECFYPYNDKTLVLHLAFLYPNVSITL